jgi:hypothetical protein
MKEISRHKSTDVLASCVRELFEQHASAFDADDEGDRTKAVAGTRRGPSSTRAASMGASVDAHQILKGFIDRTDRVLQLIKVVPETAWLCDAGIVGNSHQMCVRCAISVQYGVSVNIVVATSEDAQIERTGP